MHSQKWWLFLLQLKQVISLGSLRFFPGLSIAFIPMAGVLLSLLLRLPQCVIFFFSFLALLEVASISCSDRWELFAGLSGVAEAAFSWALSDWFSRVLSSIFSGRLPQGQRLSGCWLVGACILAFACAIVVFLTRLSQASCSQPFLSI